MSVDMHSRLRTDAAPTASAIRTILDTDPVWSAYAVADLQPDFAPHTQWCVGESMTGAGLTMLFTRLTPHALFAIGDVDAVGQAIEAAGLPDTVYMTLREEHYTVASSYYDFSADVRPMWRMALSDPAAVAELGVRLPDGHTLRTLDSGDSERIRRLYALGGPFSPDAFDAYQTADGTFFGVLDANDSLLAAGGTHIVDWQAGIGAIGNMYTHPAHRGHGLGTAVLRAIVDKLIAGNVTNILLNVDERNAAAKHLYERYGFQPHCQYLEGSGHRR